MTNSRDHTIAALFESMSALKRVMAMRMQSLGKTSPLPRGQAEMLMTIHHLQPVSSKVLADYLYLTPGAISQAIDGLEEHDLLQRHIDPTDRRKQLLQLSKKGLRMLQNMDKQRRTLMESIFEELSDEELEVWLRVQLKMLDHLQQPTTQTK